MDINKKIISCFLATVMFVCSLCITKPLMVFAEEKVNVPEEIIQTFPDVMINGVLVNSSISFLDFNKKQIADFNTFVNELGQFPFLTRVEMCGSNLSNEQMEFLQNTYPNIKFVWSLRLGNYWTVRTDQVAFSTNKGPGPNLTSADVEQLKYCTDMVALDLGHNRISDISFLYHMPKLRILILVDNRVSDLTPVASCKDLVYLETFVNPIKDVTPITNLVNLLDLNISYNRFTDIQPILHKPRLERLFVSHTGLSMAQIQELQAEYPNLHVEYQVKESIDGGWRKVPRYRAMRTMFKTNTVSELFTTDADRLSYYAMVFNYDYYVNLHPEVVQQVGSDPLEVLYYFINYGVAQGHQASPTFSIMDYAVYNTDLHESFGVDLNAYFNHYITRGYKEPERILVVNQS